MGPGGYELHRLLASMGAPCGVVAPSLIPQGALRARVKAGRRDAVRLALARRAGLLAPVRVRSPQEESVRDPLYRGGLDARQAGLAAAEKLVAAWAGQGPLAGPVARLAACRGIAQLTGLTLAAEVAGWRCGRKCPAAFAP